MSKPIQDRNSILRIATLSSGNDEAIGTIVADALESVGKDGVILIEESKSMATTFEQTSGIRFERGFISPYLVTDTEKMEAVLDEPLVLCIDQTISVATDILPILEQVVRIGHPILVVARDVIGDALALLVVNHLSKTLECCAVKVPDFGEEGKSALQDIAALTNSQIISQERGIALESITIELLGRARKVQVTKDAMTIVADSGSKESLERHMTAIKHRIDQAKSEVDKRKLRNQLGRLTGGIGIIKVGAHTETELKDRKLRFENALNASLSAREEGYVAGGGVCLIRASQELGSLMKSASGERKIGLDIVRKAFEAPLSQIASNAGLSGKIVVEKVKESDGWNGFDATTHDYADTFAAGIIDSAKVVRVAIESAVSIASLVLTTEAVVFESSDNGKL